MSVAPSVAPHQASEAPVAPSESVPVEEEKDLLSADEEVEELRTEPSPEPVDPSPEPAEPSQAVEVMAQRQLSILATAGRAASVAGVPAEFSHWASALAKIPLGPEWRNTTLATAQRMTPEQLNQQLARIVAEFQDEDRKTGKPDIGVRVIWRENDASPWLATVGIVTEVGAPGEGAVGLTAAKVSYVNGDDAPFEALIPNNMCEFGSVEVHRLKQVLATVETFRPYPRARPQPPVVQPSQPPLQFHSTGQLVTVPPAATAHETAVAHPRIRVCDYNLADARSFGRLIQEGDFNEMERRVKEMLPQLPHSPITHSVVGMMMEWIRYTMAADENQEEEDFYRVVELSLQNIRIIAAGETNGMSSVRKALQEGVSKGDEIGALLAKAEKPAKGKFTKKSFGKCFKCGQNTYNKISKKCSKCGSSGNDQGRDASKAGKQ